MFPRSAGSILVFLYFLSSEDTKGTYVTYREKEPFIPGSVEMGSTNKSQKYILEKIQNEKDVMADIFPVEIRNI